MVAYPCGTASPDLRHGRTFSPGCTSAPSSAPPRRWPSKWTTGPPCFAPRQTPEDGENALVYVAFESLAVPALRLGGPITPEAGVEVTDLLKPDGENAGDSDAMEEARNGSREGPSDWEEPSSAAGLAIGAFCAASFRHLLV